MSTNSIRYNTSYLPYGTWVDALINEFIVHEFKKVRKKKQNGASISSQQYL